MGYERNMRFSAGKRDIFPALRSTGKSTGVLDLGKSSGKALHMNGMAFWCTRPKTALVLCLILLLGTWPGPSAESSCSS